MDIDLTELTGKVRMLNSPEAEAGANRLLQRIDHGDMGMEVLPNTYVQFTGELEENDYVSYCRFLRSVNGEKLIRMLEEENAGKYLEL